IEEIVNLSSDEIQSSLETDPTSLISSFFSHLSSTSNQEFRTNSNEFEQYLQMKELLMHEKNDDNNDDELPYWDDAIEKYYDRPDHPHFHLITYPNYFCDYTIRSKQPNIEFYNVLQEIQTGHLSRRTKDIIQSKINTNNDPEKFYNTTHIVSTRQAAFNINQLLCSYLPFDHTTSEPLTSTSEDTLDFENLTETNLSPHFKHSTNLPHITYLQEEVTFPTFTNLSKVVVQKETIYFNIDGKHASRKQFPLQNAFALTAHKVQGLTLPHVTTSVDETLFAEGQAYVAMSRATSWQNLRIINFDYNYLKITEGRSERIQKVKYDTCQGVPKFKINL
ncbi:2773_t:CDS:2, partial [Diversispora eburnea]